MARKKNEVEAKGEYSKEKRKERKNTWIGYDKIRIEK